MNQYDVYPIVDSAQLSYYDVSGGVSSEDIFVRVYLNIVRKSDGSIGYPPERLDNIKGILDGAFNPHGIYFIYDCEDHFVDDDDLFFSGTSFHSSNFRACDWFSFPHHEDGIDIYLIHSHISQGSGDPTIHFGLAEGIPGSWFITKAEDSSWDQFRIESPIIVQKMGHLFGLFRTGHGSQLNSHYYASYPDPPPYSLKFDCDVLDYVVADPHECPEHATNGGSCGDYIPDTERSHHLLEKCHTYVTCPTPPNAQDYFHFSIANATCTTVPTDPEFLDILGNPYNNIPFYNYMSRSAKECLNYFTQGQVDVMRNFLLTHPTLSSVTMTSHEVAEFCPCVDEEEVVVISENTTISGDETMSGTVVVETGNRLTVTGTMRMLPGTNIFVERGAVLEINGGLITRRCDDMWKGIQVQGNSGKIQPDYPYTSLASDDAGVVLIRSNGTIEWAINAIQTRDDRISWPAFADYYGGVVDSEDGIFRSNKWGVGFMKYEYPNKSDFNRTFFYGTTEIPSRSGVSIWGCQDINFRRCHFEDFSQYGITGINFHSWIYHSNTFINIPEAIKTQATYPFGSNLVVGSHLSQHGSNYFIDNQYAIVAEGTDFAKGLEVIDNSISKSSNYGFSQSANAGVRIIGPSVFDVTQNSIMDQSNGVWVHNTGQYHTLARCNNIFASHQHQGANYGILAALNNQHFQFKYNYFDMDVCGPDVKLRGTSRYPNVCRHDVGEFGDPARNCYTFDGNPQIVTSGQTTIFRYWVSLEPEDPCQIPTDNLSDMGSNQYYLNQTDPIEDPYCGLTDVPLNLDSAYQATLSELYLLGWNFGQNDTSSQILNLLEKMHLYRKHLIDQWWGSESKIQIENLLKEDQSNIGRRNLLGYYLKIAEYSKAEQQMDSLAMESDDDLAFYYIQSIVLDYMRDTMPTVLTVPQKNELISIAENEDLPSTVYARALLTKLDPSFGPKLPPDLGLCTYSQSNREIEEELASEEKKWDGFSLSPVPASNEILVSWKSAFVAKGYHIYDLRGNLLQENTNPFNSGSTVDVSHLPSGMYIFALVLEDGSLQTNKLLLQ